MNSNPIQLANAHFDGRPLTEEEAKFLSNWVKADPANARTIVELGLINTQVEYLLSIPVFLNELRDSVQVTAAGKSGPPQRGTARNDKEQSPAETTVVSTLRTRSSRWWSAIAAVLLVSAIGFSLSKFATDEASPHQTIAHGTTETAPSTALHPVLATITESLGVSWDREDEPRRGLHLRRQETIHLAEGVLLLTTASGSEVVVQAPAIFCFDEHDQIDLSSGKLTARVEGVPNGLTVNTPTAKVVDLGTEFGVGVGDEHDTLVAVCDGAVELSGRSDQPGGEMPVQLVTAGRSGYVGPDGTVRWIVETLRHDRDFIRPDEINSLRQARSGSQQAKQQLAYYSLQRTKGLVGFQCFDIPSSGAAFSQAFRNEPARTDRSLRFARDLVKGNLYSSGSLHVGADESVFLDLDTTTDSPLAHAGLLTERERVGRSGTQLWLAWNTQSMKPKEQGDFAGLSLMFGDTRIVQEPLFVGLVDGGPNLHLATNVGSQLQKVVLDADPTTFQFDPLPADGKVRQWIARIIFAERSDTVSVWCDVPVDQILESRPLAELTSANVTFDRIKLSVGRGGGAWRFDDFLLGVHLEAISNAFRLQGEHE